MNALSEKQQRIVKIIVGAATLVCLFWLVRSTGVVHESLRTSAETGKLGNPAIAGVLVMLAEGLAVIGGYMIVMSTGLWRFFADQVSPFFEQDNGMNARQYIDNALKKPTDMPPERRAELEQALILSAEERDFKSVIMAAEKIAGEQFFPRKSKPIESPVEEVN